MAEKQAHFRMSINGHELIGTQRGGEWTFECDAWPALAKKWNGDTVFTNILDEFMKRVLADEVPRT